MDIPLSSMEEASALMFTVVDAAKKDELKGQIQLPLSLLREQDFVEMDESKIRSDKIR